MTNRIHVRGQMGVQLLQTALGIARMPDDEEPIVVVNTGGLTNGAANLGILEPKFRVTEVPDVGKTPYWVPGAATEIFTNLPKVQKWMKLNKQSYRVAVDAAFHLRGGDKETMSPSSAFNWKQTVYALEFRNTNGVPDIREYGNHPLVVERTNDPVDDWFDIYNTSRLYAGPSAYIMSMLLFNPHKTIVFADESWHDGPYPFVGNDFVFLREAAKFCPGVQFISKDTSISC
jgi:hypothetical protein